MKKAYLLSWNPDKWAWEDIDVEIEHIKHFGSVPSYWNCRSKQPKNGDLVFIISVGKKIKNGIYASGIVDCIVDNQEDFLDPNKLVRKVYFDFNIIIKPSNSSKILEAKYLIQQFPVQDWTPQGSGIEIKDEILDEFLVSWNKFLHNNHPEYVQNAEYWEDIAPQKLYTPYERNPKARIECIKHYGYNCIVCKMNLESIYGQLGKNFIHVHHEKFVSSYSGKHLIDPIKDLKPVCPNCHSMLHRKIDGKHLSIKELEKLLKQP